MERKDMDFSNWEKVKKPLIDYLNASGFGKEVVDKILKDTDTAISMFLDPGETREWMQNPTMSKLLDEMIGYKFVYSLTIRDLIILFMDKKMEYSQLFDAVGLFTDVICVVALQRGVDYGVSMLDDVIKPEKEE